MAEESGNRLEDSTGTGVGSSGFTTSDNATSGSATPGNATPESHGARSRLGYTPTPVHELRRRRIRLVANILIISASLALVGIVLYFVVTWLIASANQEALRDELTADNPGLAEAVENVSDEDFITIGTLIQDAVEAQYQKELVALEAAADDYYRKTIRLVGKAMGELVIPKIGVETIMAQGNFEGRGERYLRQGPGHWPETPVPGQGGSVVVSGHRTTYGAPFRKLDELQPGDKIELTMPYAVFRYRVTQVIVVAPDEVQVVADQGKEMISLVACHPLHSAKQRIIAQADLDSFVLLEAEQSETEQ